MICSDISNDAANHGVLINLTNHRLPDHVFKALEAKKNIKSFSVFAETASFDYSQDLWQQVEDVTRQLAKKEQNGKTAFTTEGQKFIFLPGSTAGAFLLGTFFAKVWGHYPHLCIIGKDKKTNVESLIQVIDLDAFAKKSHNFWRGVHIFNKDETELTQQIKAKNRKTA